MFTKHKIIITSFTMWGSIGFMRGVQSYNFENVTTLYTDKFFNGILGTFLYINPCTAIFMFYKELYRLEVNIFNIKLEKECNFYNKLIF